MRVARVSWVAFLITAALPLWQAASEPITQEPEPLSAFPASDLAPALPSDELSASLRSVRLDAKASHDIPQAGTVASPSRTVFLQLGAETLPKLAPAGPPPAIEALLGPDRALSPREAAPVPDVSDAESLVASLPKDLIAEKEMAAEIVRGVVLSEPLTVIISLKDQKLDVYRGLERVESTRISSGKRGYETLTGVFGILQKKREHFSNLYDSAPMPWMQRLTRSGTALHAGPVPNYPASHGCVRMPYGFAPKLFRTTEVGGKVVMMRRGMVAPEVIAHHNLLKPQTAHDTVPATGSVAAGMKEAARTMAEASSEEGSPSSDAPLRILVTRREERDIAIGVQEILASMGYLPPEDRFVGYLGDGTKRAIKAFEKDHGLPQRGRFTEEIAAKIYEAAGKGPLPDAYIFLRKGFSRVWHVPVKISEPRKSLGTHLFTYMRPSDGGAPRWASISLEGEDSKKVLDRITIPDDMRTEISKGLTSGAAFIVADKALHSSVLPEGDDFIVRTNDSATSNAVAEKPKAARKKVVAKPQRRSKRAVRLAPKTRQVTQPRGFGLFSRRR